MASESIQYSVHLGFWTNWSLGKIQGATITLTRRNGGFLIAFLAIFVGMVGKSFWRLICFMLHRYFSSSISQDGLYHQRQAILRNSDTAQDGAWRMLMSLCAWHSGRRASRPILRLLPIIVLASAISFAFGVASIFSSHVTTDTANEVLLKGTRCGTLNSDQVDDLTKYLAEFQPYTSERANQFLNYGMQCYTNTSSSDGCNLYIKPQLPLKSGRGVACPFKEGICKLEADNLELDTGYLNSLEHLGINLSPSERFEFRMVHQCAPIKTEGYTEQFNDSHVGPVMRYLYGENLLTDAINNGTRWTYEVPVNNTYVPVDGTPSVGVPRREYSLGMDTSYGTPNISAIPLDALNWMPIPALQREDADVHLMYLSAPGIQFSAPVDDPWFSAHTPIRDIHSRRTNASVSSYAQDEPMSPMACSFQMQYCNPLLSSKPAEERCEPMRGLIDPRKSDAMQKIFPNQRQLDAAARADRIIVRGTYAINTLVGYVGASALRTRYGLAYGFQGPLPTNQWQIEAENWVKAGLASLQDVFVTGANGPPHALDDFLEPPAQNETVAREMCGNQKIVSTGFSSFNVLGISLILGLGSVIIVLDIGLEPLVAWWQRRQYTKRQMRDQSYPNGKAAHPLYSVLEWSHTSTLQLQRLAHEEAGYGSWSACDGDTPVTRPGEQLAALDLREVERPVLRKEGNNRKWLTKRSDTGLETLVEELEEEKAMKMEGEDMDVVIKVMGRPVKGPTEQNRH